MQRDLEIKKSLEKVGVHLDIANSEYAKVIRLMTPDEKKETGLSKKHIAQAIGKRKLNRYKK